MSNEKDFDSSIANMFGRFQTNLNQEFIESKSWGYRYSVHNHGNCQVDMCCIKKGGYSSWHHHTHKFNRFLVLEGQLEIYLSGTLKPYLIGDCQKTRKFDVKAGMVHKFIALTNVQLLEVYYTICSDKDIIRQDKGGVCYEK